MFLLGRLRYLSCGNLVRQIKQPSRRVSFFSKKVEPPQRLFDREKHKVIYDFKWIVLPVGFLKARYVPLVLSVVTAPLFYYFLETSSVVWICLLAGTIQFLLIVAMSRVLTNTVGKMYINRNGNLQEIIVGAINELGQRVDKLHSPGDLLLCNYGHYLGKRAGFAKISVKNSDLVYKINVKSCKVHDKEAWKSVFGSYIKTEK